MEQTPGKILEAFRAGEATAEMKRALARSLVPLGPEDLLEVLTLLIRDTDEGIRDSAVRSLKDLPPAVVLGAASSPSSAAVLLERLARLYARSAPVLEAVLLNPATAEETIEWIATRPFPALLDIIGRRTDLLDHRPLVAENLEKNPATPPEVLDRWREHRERLAAAETARTVPVAGMDEEVADEPQVVFDEVLTGEEEEAPVAGGPHKDAEAQNARQLSIYQMLKKMSMGQKVALAVKGNREVRAFLIREKNRMLALKVLENPRMTDSDVEAFAKSTNVAEDVLRGIANHREWCRRLPVVKALVNNPKTPLGVSLDFIKRLGVRDLENLSKNRNIPDTLRSNARRLFKLKRDSKK